MKELSMERTESLSGGWGLTNWLELGCVAGGISLSLLSGPAFAVGASLTIHVCGAYFLSKAEMKPSS